MSASLRNPTILALAAVLIVALSLRLFNLGWDQGQYLHPDERFIADVSTSRIIFEWPLDFDNLLDADNSLLNPRSIDPETGRARDFSYGALPLFVTDLTGTVLTRITGVNWSTYSGYLYKTGRILSAIFDTLTVLVIYLIGVRVAGRRAALFAAIVAAITPMAIQLAHFFTTDSWLTFFVSLTIWLSLRAMDSGTRRAFALAGLSFGLAMATKGSVFTLAALVTLAVILAAWQRRIELGRMLEAAIWALERAILAGLAALAAFATFEPYALVRPHVYIDQLMNQSRIIRGIFDVPFTRQYIGTTPVLYQINELVRWGYGPVAGILIFVGAAVLGRRLIKMPDAAGILLIAWFVGYGIVIALPETKFLRYLAPLIPVFALLAGIAIEAIASWFSNRGRTWLAAAAPVVLLLGAAFWTAAFMNVYAQPHPRIAASEWIYANVPPGSVVSAEYWDDALPLDLSPTLNPGAFNFSWVSFDHYNSLPAEQVADTLFNQMSETDYIFISSNRVMSAMPQSPWRYPVQIEFYDLLQDGSLGFEQVAEFQTMPSFLGVAFDDSGADESFINYDHPRVLLYQKVRNLERDEFDLLMADATSQTVTPTRHANTETIMLDEPVGELPVVDDARWSAAWTDNVAVALLWWIVLLIALQAVGLPIALLAFRKFADRGWAFARLSGLVIAGWLVWMMASLEIFAFSSIWVWIAMASLALFWLVGKRTPVSLLRNAWSNREQRRTIVVAEVVFWGVFALFLLFRFLNPDSWQTHWGGEKPMEFAHINAILRSAHFPPYDPWFSDGYLNYYYYGLYLVAFLMKATGIPSEIAFNLAQPTIIALLAVGGYGVAATLGRLISRSRRSAPVVGLFGVVVLLLIGNLTAVVRVLDTLPSRISPDFGWFWGGTRVITVPDPRFIVAQQITEFPYFTAVFADLHAHVVALPITVLAIAIGLAIALEHRAVLVALERKRVEWAKPAICLVLFGALVVGSLFPTNAWDFFTYAVFIVASIFLLFRQLNVITRIAATLVVGGFTVVLGYFLFLPFHASFVTLFSQVKPSEQKTDIWQFAQHFGGLFLLTALGLIALIWTQVEPQKRSLSPSVAAGTIIVFLGILGILGRLTEIDRELLGGIFAGGFAALALVSGGWWKTPGRWSWNRHLMIAGAVLVCGMLFDERYVLALCFALTLLSATVFFALSGSAERIVALCATAGFAIPGMVELIYVVDDLDGGPWARMNTMFKFYNQAWVLLAISGGVLTGWLIVEAIGKPLVLHARNRESGFSPTLPMIVTVGVIALSLVYTITTTVPRLEMRFDRDLGSNMTLNGLEWMSYATYQIPGGPMITWEDDLAAIEWFNQEVEGSPVIVEASIGPYRGNGSRFSIATGLPAVLGWERHEQQQRYPADSAERMTEVRQFYQTADIDEKLAFLARHDVQYVIVGDLERYGVLGENSANPYATPEGIAAIESMVGHGLEIAFQQGTTTVYRVSQPGADGGAP